MTNGVDFSEPEPHVNDAAPDGDDRPWGESPPCDAEPSGVAAESWDRLTIDAPREWYDKPPPNREWLLRDARHPKARGVFPLGKVGQLIAGGGIGKTLVLCQLAVAVATGSNWLGALSVAKPGRVLLLLGEEDREECQRRLYNARRASGAKSPEAGAIVLMPLAGVMAPMQNLDSSGNIIDTDFLRWLRTYVEAGAFRLVGVDPLSRFGSPRSELENKAATAFIQALETLAAPDRSVLNAHHVNQGSRSKGATLDVTSGRGVTGLVDGARWQCGLTSQELKFESPEERERLGEIVTFTVTKSNYAAKPEPILLRRDNDNGGALVPVDDSDLEIIEAARADAELKTPRRQAREAEKGSKLSKEDEAVIQAVRAEPGITFRDLRTRVAAIAGCGRERAEVAIARVLESGRLDVRSGPRKSKLHYLRDEEGPE